MTTASQRSWNWGGHLLEEGGAEFRLWAPAADRLSLRLEGAGELDMERQDDGWFALRIDGAEAGQAYAFQLPEGMAVPDPAARAQADDVHGPSLLIDPKAYRWRTQGWRGRPWNEAVIYELHVGTFSPEGTFDGVIRRLDYLAGLGVTAIELMPVAQFSGVRGWGYDGVLPYCPHSAYGGVEGLKRLVDEAHARGVMVLLDVVYNHFGPDGNYLGLYAPDFFDESRHTPWGPAIRFEAAPVRAFFVENPLYWLEEFRLDGLRFDAIDQIGDTSATHILEEMAGRVRAQFPHRHVHLTTEDERNIVILHPHERDGRPRLFSAEWNDDFHHAAHCIATGEDAGYYAAFNDDPVGHLVRVLAEGFAYQGEPYGPWKDRPRGVASAGQPPTSFVAFLQNHDQIGNRAFGQRLTLLADPEMLHLLTAILFLNPQIPLIFMGEEYAETRPFLFFTDFHGELADAVREGRRREFAQFGDYSDEKASRIPDPNALMTFEASSLDWTLADTASGSRWQNYYRHLITLRRDHIVPRLAGVAAMNGRGERLGPEALVVDWYLSGQIRLRLWANLGTHEVPNAPSSDGFTLVFGSRPEIEDRLATGILAERCVVAGISDPSEAGDG